MIRNYPQYSYIQHLPIKRVHLYTFVQLICDSAVPGCQAMFYQFYHGILDS